MAIFYTDSGSFNTLEVTGSTILSGSLIVSGATNFGPSGLTGSLFGTSSFADSSSVAVSSSYAQTASFALNAGGSEFPFSGSAVITGSLLVSGSSQITGSLELSRLYTGDIEPVSKSVILNSNSNYPLIITGSGRSSLLRGPGVFRVGTFDGPFGSTAQIELLNDGFGTKSNLLIVNDGSGDDDPTAAIIYSGSTRPFSIQNLNGGVGLLANGQISLSGTSVIIGNVSPAGNRLAISGSVSASSYTSSLNNQVGFFGTSSFAVSAQNGFPFSGSAVITGSLLISSSGATDGLQVSGSTRAIGKIDVVSPANTASSMSISVGDVAGYASFKVSSDIVYYEFSSTQVVFNLGLISTTDVSVRGAIKDDNNLALRITGGTANITHLSSSLIVTGSQAITASNVQLNNLADTTSTNKVLVLDTATNKIFTTASVGTGGGPGGSAFPYDGTVTPAVISGSLIISGSGATPALRVTGSTTFRGSGSTVFAISGSLGPLFEVTDSISGELFTLTSASIDIFKVDNQQNVLVSGSLKVNNTLHVTGSTILSSSGTSLQVTGSSNFRDNLTVNGGTLFVDTANNRTNMSGSIAVTGSMTMLSSSLVINTGSITINTGSLTVDQLPGQTSGITLRVTGSNQVLYIGNDGQGSSFLKTNNTQLRFGGLGSTGFAWDGLSLYPEATDEEGLGSTSNRWQRLVVNQVTASIVSASAGITGSLAQFNPVSLKLTVGTTAPSSPAVNDLWVDTN